MQNFRKQVFNSLGSYARVFTIYFNKSNLLYQETRVPELEVPYINYIIITYKLHI